MKSTIYRLTILLPCILAWTWAAHAQFPTFTPVDTGAIVDLSIGHENLSAHMFDVDNDGDVDPVIGYSSGDNFGNPAPLKLFRNEGNGLFIPSLLLPETSHAFHVRFTSPAADIDNDGDIDVIGQKKFATSMGTFFNDGHGNFTSDTMFNVPNSFDSPYAVLLDFNRDGFIDIMRFDKYIHVVYNNGHGKFLEKDTIGYYGQNAWIHHSVCLADADNDGDMDAYCGHSFNTEKNYFFINTGDSLEQVGEDHITLSDATTTVCVNWIDYDNDGDMDLYVHNYTADTIDGPLPALYENLGNLDFEKHTIHPDKYRGV